MSGESQPTAVVLDDDLMFTMALEPALRRLGYRVRTLSGGEYQRVALARTLVLEPDALLLDEPTSNLDPENVALIERLVEETRRERGMTVIWVTHNPFQASRVAQSAVLLIEGVVAEHSPVEVFFGEGASLPTRAFLGGKMVW